MLNHHLHLKAEFVHVMFIGLRLSKSRKLLFAEIIDEALDAGDILTAQEICERFGATMSKAAVDDVENEVRALEEALEIIVDDEDVVEEVSIPISLDLSEIIEVDLSDIDDSYEAVANSGKVIPFRAVA